MKGSIKMAVAAASLAILSLSAVAQATPVKPHPHYLEVAESRIEPRTQKEKENGDRDADRDTEVKDDKVPAPLSKVGEEGESVYDMAKISNWKQAKAHLTSLTKELPLLQKEHLNVSGLKNSINSLNKAIALKNRQQTMRDANQVTFTAAQLTKRFHAKVPVEVTFLDYYGRELEIWSAAADTGKLKMTASNLRQTWNAVRPSVEKHGGKTEARKFSLLVNRTNSAQSASDYARLATPILDEVDRLEQVFQ